MEARAVELGLTWSDVARISGVDRETLRKMRFGLGGRRGFAPITKRVVEDALQWRHGSIDTVLANGDPTIRDDNSQGRTPLPTVTTDVDPTFDGALEEYQKALRLLRRAAATDPGVSSEVADVVETWNTQLQALLYGGVKGVRKAVGVIAESYERDHSGEEGATRAG